MHPSPAVSAMCRTMKLLQEHPNDIARIDHVADMGEPLLVPLVFVGDAGDISEIQDNSGLPRSALTQAMREVSGMYPGRCGPLAALSTIEQAKDLCHAVSCQSGAPTLSPVPRRNRWFPPR